MIDWYLHVDNVLCDDGYGKDDYLSLEKNLILVTWVVSWSGKMSTCLGQIYHDYQKDIKSGYAKYETFPIWNLSVDHPVNLAYEATTVDIGDFNCIDTYHKEAYGLDVVNYNRDIEAFEIVMHISKDIVNHKNYMRKWWIDESEKKNGLMLVMSWKKSVWNTIYFYQKDVCDF